MVLYNVAELNKEHLVTKNLSIAWVTARFTDPETESAYQKSVHARHFRSNVWGVIIGIVFVSIYIFAEFLASHNPSFGVVVRIVTVAIASVLLALMLNTRYSIYHDAITLAIFTVMGIATNLNIWYQPGLDNSFYLGLIQGYIMFTLILRLNFTSIFFIIAFTQVSFFVVAFGKNDLSAALLQSADTLVIAVICTAGAYILQRYQRSDFLKNQLIEDQNTQLSGLLADAERDNERKIAALNTLVHFVKTPLHQIAGFSDVVVNSITDNGSDEVVENVRYIKNATTDLTKSVNGLLAYHRLDETESSIQPESTAISMVVHDLEEFLPDLVPSAADNVEGERVLVDPAALRAAMQGFADHYANQQNHAGEIKLGLERNEGFVEFAMTDGAPTLSRSEFADYAQPLTKLDGYLTQTGEQMPMGLRTVARAIDILGGSFTHTPRENGNCYVMTLPVAEPREERRSLAQ